MKSILFTILFGAGCLASYSQSLLNTDHDKDRIRKNGVHVQTKWKYRPGADEGVKVLTKTFDKQGNVLQELNFLPDGSNSSRLTYKYDSEGKKIYYQLYDFTKEPDKRITYVQNIEYNDQGYRKAEKGFDGIDEFRLEYNYLQAGKLNEVIKYNNVGEVTERHSYAYSGQTLTIIIYGLGSNVKEKIRETYDNNRNLIEKANLQPNNTITKLVRYKYDTQNRLIEEEEYFNGRFSFKLTYNYGTEGYISSIEKEDVDGKVFINNSYAYDQKGNLIEEKWYDGKPDDYSKKSYNYDEKDNLKEVDSYYSLYRYKVLYKYTYEFY